MKVLNKVERLILLDCGASEARVEDKKKERVWEWADEVMALKHRAIICRPCRDSQAILVLSQR